MQENITIARPYARAVFEQGKADGELEQWSGMLQLLRQVVADAAMQALIKNPKVDNRQMADIVFDICGAKLNQQGKNFVRVLIDAGRLSVVEQIYKLFVEQKAIAEGVAGVEVISAYPLEEQQQEKIRQMMARRLGKKIELTTRIDQGLIGGAIIRTGDSVIDASLKGRLKQLGHQFAE
jgi:F-type H+-transporting ATPase subunit delta